MFDELIGVLGSSINCMAEATHFSLLQNLGHNLRNDEETLMTECDESKEKDSLAARSVPIPTSTKLESNVLTSPQKSKKWHHIPPTCNKGAWSIAEITALQVSLRSYKSNVTGESVHYHLSRHLGTRTPKQCYEFVKRIMVKVSKPGKRLKRYEHEIYNTVKHVMSIGTGENDLATAAKKSKIA